MGVRGLARQRRRTSPVLFGAATSKCGGRTTRCLCPAMNHRNTRFASERAHTIHDISITSCNQLQKNCASQVARGTITSWASFSLTDCSTMHVCVGLYECKQVLSGIACAQDRRSGIKEGEAVTGCIEPVGTLNLHPTCTFKRRGPTARDLREPKHFMCFFVRLCSSRQTKNSLMSRRHRAFSFPQAVHIIRRRVLCTRCWFTRQSQNQQQPQAIKNCPFRYAHDNNENKSGTVTMTTTTTTKTTVRVQRAFFLRNAEKEETRLCGSWLVAQWSIVRMHICVSTRCCVFKVNFWLQTYCLKKVQPSKL